MNYIPGAGLKKPLNIIQAPIFPDIKQDYPKFKWSKKHWKVDSGLTMLETETMSNFYDNAVLVQSRDYNQTVYGKNSHRDYVNEEFRPPLLTQEDSMPLSRIPRKRVTPRTNPGTANDFGTNGYRAQNDLPSDATKYINEKDIVTHSNWRPTFYRDVQGPQDNSILPTLDSKISASATAGFNSSLNVDGERGEYRAKFVQDYAKNDTEINAKFFVPFISDGYNAKQDMTLKNNRPSVSVNSGKNYGGIASTTNTDILFGFNDDLKENRPRVSAHSGRNYNHKSISENDDVEFFGYETKDNRPNVAVNSGKMYNHKSINDNDDIEFFGYEAQDNRPSVSVNSGKTYNHKSINDNDDVEFFGYEAKDNRPKVSVNSGRNYNPITRISDDFNDIGNSTLDQEKLAPRYSVINPSPNVQSRNADELQKESYRLRSSLQRIGVNVNKQNPYNDDNDRSYNNNINSNFREKQHSLQKKQGYHTKGYIPRSGVDIQPIALRDTSKTPKKYSYSLGKKN
jgi:hypothetical protein